MSPALVGRFLTTAPAGKCHLPFLNHNILVFESDFPGSSDGKASAYNAGDPGSIQVLLYHLVKRSIALSYHFPDK